MTEATVTGVDLCKRGHPRTAENTTVRMWRHKGIEREIRQCRVCARTAAKARRERTAGTAEAEPAQESA